MDGLASERPAPLAWLQAQPGWADLPAPTQARLAGLARRAEAAAPRLRAQLWAQLQRRWAAAQPGPVPVAGLQAAASPAWAPALLAGLEPTRSALRTAEQDPRRWTRRRLERRLAEPVQVEAAAPQALLGPLHTQVLLPRALQRLRQLSPDYLQRLLAQVDALALLAPPPAPAPEARPVRGPAQRAGAKAKARRSSAA